MASLRNGRLLYLVPLLLALFVAGCGGEQAAGGGPSLGLLRVIYAEDRFVVGEGGGAMLTSRDGQRWTAVQTSPRQPVSAIAKDDSQFVALGYGVFGEDAVLLSSDARQWRVRWLGHLEEFTAMRWTGNRFVAVGEMGSVLVSADGEDWRFIDNGVTQEDYLRDLLWDGTRLFAVGWNGWVLTSRDEGETWAGQQLAGNPNLEAIAWNGSRYVTVGLDGALYTSEDGDNWQAADAGTERHLLALAWGGGRFVTAGFEGYLAESTDGLTWRPLASGTDRILSSAAWGGGRFVVVGHDSTILHFEPGAAPRRASIDTSAL